MGEFIEVHRGGPEVLGRLHSDWLKLCETGGCNTPFNRPEYFASYVKAFEPQSTLAIVTIRNERELIGVLPLVEVRERWFGLPMRLLSSPRGNHYDWFDLLCKAGVDAERLGG
ncbi:MAG: hypothetical protein ACXWP5_05900, partial [Bdellovibrionota bacterium]